ncbi:MAG: hypothetical protein Q9227_006809 [Pyrenula ochraceoflavens]
MKSFIRSPTWIAPSQGFVDPKNEGPKNFEYTAEEKQKFREDPDMFLAYRKKIEADMNRTFDTFLKDSEKQQSARVEFAKLMKNRLNNDERLAEALTPKWAVGCRRLTPGQNFLETLVKENVEVVTEDIDHVEAEGIVTKDGTLHRVDAIISATGFDTSYRPRFRLVGRHGVELADQWADTNAVEAYLALAIPGYPNYFTTEDKVRSQPPPFFPFFDNPLTNHPKKHRSFSPSATATKHLNAHHQRFLQRMVFSDPCRSWYKGGRAEGKVIGIWPGSSLHYYETLSEPRYEDWDYEYEYENGGNIWGYLGNGWTEIETRDRERREGGEEEGEDLAWYLKKPEKVLSAPES